MNGRGIGDGYIEVEVTACQRRAWTSPGEHARTRAHESTATRCSAADYLRSRAERERERAGRGDRRGGGSLFGCGEEGSWAGAMPQGRRNASAPAPVTDEPSPNMHGPGRRRRGQWSTLLGSNCCCCYRAHAAPLRLWEGTPANVRSRACGSDSRCRRTICFGLLLLFSFPEAHFRQTVRNSFADTWFLFFHKH